VYSQPLFNTSLRAKEVCTTPLRQSLCIIYPFEELGMAPGKIVYDAELGFEYVEWDVNAWAEEELKNNPYVEAPSEVQSLNGYGPAD